MRVFFLVPLLIGMLTATSPLPAAAVTMEVDAAGATGEYPFPREATKSLARGEPYFATPKSGPGTGGHGSVLAGTDEGPDLGGDVRRQQRAGTFPPQGPFMYLKTPYPALPLPSSTTYSTGTICNFCHFVCSAKCRVPARRTPTENSRTPSPFLLA